MTTTLKQTQTAQRQQQPLSIEERATIARVLSWDTCEDVHPEQIEAIWMEGDIAWIRLDKGCVPIHKQTFQDILAAQREIETKGDDRENIETRTHQNELLNLVPVQNVPHAYEVFYLGQPLGYVYCSLLLGGWGNTQCKASFVDPFDAAERLFLDWQVERELGFTLPY